MKVAQSLLWVSGISAAVVLDSPQSMAGKRFCGNITVCQGTSDVSSCAPHFVGTKQLLGRYSWVQGNPASQRVVTQWPIQIQSQSRLIVAHGANRHTRKGVMAVVPRNSVSSAPYLYQWADVVFSDWERDRVCHSGGARKTGMRHLSHQIAIARKYEPSQLSCLGVVGSSARSPKSSSIVLSCMYIAARDPPLVIPSSGLGLNKSLSGSLSAQACSWW